MKSFRRFGFLAVALLFFACAKNAADDAAGSPEQDGHRVSVAATLSELHAVLSEIDGSVTRGGSSRRVGSVAAVKASDVSSATHAGEGTDIEELIYIANFENGEGYAILGADDRVPSVIAITEQGSLTSEELVTAANDAESGNADSGNPGEAPAVIPELAAYVAGLGSGGLGDGGFGGGPGGWTGDIDTGDGLPWQRYTHYCDWEAAMKVGPLLEMKWDQEAPYNYFTPENNGQHCVVGCVAVALGQIIAQNAYTHYVQVGNGALQMFNGGWIVSWSKIGDMIDRYVKNPDAYTRNLDSDETDAEKLNVGQLLRAIGEGVKMNYGIENSRANINDAVNFLQNVMLYKNVGKYDYSTSKIHSMVLDKHLPIYVNGRDDGGHAWVIDGVLRQKRRVETCLMGGQVIDYYTEERTLYHCNYGYSGASDGYYRSEVFDLNAGPLEAEPEKGDFKSSNSPVKNYDYNNKVIVYDL